MAVCADRYLAKSEWGGSRVQHCARSRDGRRTRRESFEFGEQLRDVGTAPAGAQIVARTYLVSSGAGTCARLIYGAVGATESYVNQRGISGTLGGGDLVQVWVDVAQQAVVLLLRNQSARWPPRLATRRWSLRRQRSRLKDPHSSN